MTEEQLKRIEEIRTDLMLDRKPAMTVDDVKLLLGRIAEIQRDADDGHESAIEWLRVTLTDMLRSYREWLEDSIEQCRIAELSVREAEAALAAVATLQAGAMFAHGEEINKHWDFVRDEYAKRGLLPVHEAAPEPEPVVEAKAPEPPPAAPEKPVRPKDRNQLAKAIVDEATEEKAAPPLSDADYLMHCACMDILAQEANPPKVKVEEIAAAVTAKAFAPKPEKQPTRADLKERYAEQSAKDEQRAFDALKSLAQGQPQVQASLSVIARAADISPGSILVILRRLAEAHRIEIVPQPKAGGTPPPNVYRFVDVGKPPRPAYTVPEKVTVGSPLRDRIAAALALNPGTSMGLAMLLDVKELAISQTLAAMEHEGIVEPEPMPEAGRRAQRWGLKQVAA